MKRHAPFAALAAAVLLAPAGPAAAQTAADNCTALNNLQIDAAFVTSANVNPGDDALPAFCQIRATALPAISIEVRLRIEGWNGKLYQTGCGGFCGILGRADAGKGFVNAMGPGLAKGYATATSDSGHHGLSVVDASWADHNPNAERDWGWRSIGETNRVAKALLIAFYADGPNRSYFQGCSTGGRMAHMASLRYPEMFNGIISGAPAMDYTGLVATNMAWLIQANTDENGETILKPGKDGLIGDEVMRQCDGADGATDGLIADPRACQTDLNAIQCKAGDAPETCLSEAELGVVAKWRQGPVNAAGESLFPGSIPEGSEPFWWLWLTGKPEGGGKLTPLFGQNFMAYMAFADDPGAGYSPLDFDFETDPARLATMAAVYNSDDPDISKFRDAGGKMIVWHGWADAIVPPAKTIAWHEAMAAKMGGAEAAADVVRLFMIPGMDHCGLLPGPGEVNQHSIDPLTALETWVETGAAPDTIMK